MAWSFLSKRFQLHPFSVDLHPKREDLTLMILGILVLVFVLFLFWLLRPAFLLLYALHTLKRSIRVRLKAVDDDSTPRFFSISETETLTDMKTGNLLMCRGRLYSRRKRRRGEIGSFF
jgi:hypothetical protein